MQFSRICCNRSAVTFIFQLPRERNGEIVFLQVPADPRVRALKGQKGKSRTNAIAQQTSGDRTAIRPFQVDVPEAKIAKLRSRIDATEWPDPETVADESQGMQLATMQELARYWATDYDWRKPREVGRSAHTENSSTTTRLTREGTMRPGNSRNSFHKRFARASGHCANRYPTRAGSSLTRNRYRWRRASGPHRRSIRRCFIGIFY
jgi:hypothetical protein